MMDAEDEVGQAIAWMVANAPRLIVPFVKELQAANLRALPDCATLSAVGGFIDGMAEWALDKQGIGPLDPGIISMKLQMGMAGWDYAEQMVTTAREIH